MFPTVYVTENDVCPAVALNVVIVLSIPCFSFVVPVVAKYSMTTRLSPPEAPLVNSIEVPFVAE